MAASPDHPTDAAGAVVRLALQVGATAVAHTDVPAMLSGVCAALPSAVGVAGAVLLLTGPADPRDPRAGQMFASDDAAGRLGTIQQRTGRGPVPSAVRSDRPSTVPDLTLAGPPELAAAAADCGLVRSLVVPLPVAGRPGGGLQLLARADDELDERAVGVLWPLVTALSARLTDARELARRAAPPPPTAARAAAAPASVTPATAALPVAATTAAPVAAPEQPAGPEAAAPDPGWTLRMPAATTDGPVVPDMVTERDSFTDLFAAGETSPDTPPAGQTGLGWDDLEHPPSLPRVPVRPPPARVRALGPVRRPRVPPVPTAVPRQRSGPVPEAPPGPPSQAPPGPAPEAVPALPGPPPGPAPGDDDGLDGPTWRVPRHRLRDD